MFMDIITDFFNLAGSLVCHQLPSRTLYASGIPLPVCARDTGIYLGIFITTAFVFLWGRGRSDRQPSLPYAVLLCLLMFPMMIDATGSYLGLIRTGNTARLITGCLFGMSLMIFLIPAANFKINSPNRDRVIRSPLEPAVLLAASLLACLAVLRGLVPYVVLGTVIVASMIFLIGRLVFTILALTGMGKARLLLKTTAATVCILTVMYTVSALILQPLKAILLERG